MEPYMSDEGFSTVNESLFDVALDEDNLDLDLTNYEEIEIIHINEVMLKDKALRAEERARKKKLEESLEETIMSIEINNVDSGEKFCLVCCEKFSMILNQRKVCTLCEKGVCGGCIYKFYKNQVLVCKLCFLNSTKDGKTGKWFLSMSKTNGRFRRSARLVLMSSLRKIKSMSLEPSKFNSSFGSRSINAPEPIRELMNGDTHQPVYFTKKNSPRPPRKTYLEKEAVPISFETSRNAGNNHDTRDYANKSLTRKDAPPIPKEMLVASREVPTPHKEINDDSYRYTNGAPSNLGSMASMSSSVMSVYSETDESFKTGIPVSGDIYFYIFYDESGKSLNIYIDQCRNIAVADRKKRRTDPYIKTYLLPDKTKISKKKSTVKKMTVNPVFKETLTYYIPRSDLESRTLSMSVWHKSSFLKYNIFLGEIQLILSDTDLTEKECIWLPFHEKRKYPMRSAGLIFKGELSIKLKYKPSTRKDGKGALHVCVVGATKLESERASVNSYVKGYLLPDKDPKSKKKTNVCKNTLNPIWNSLLQFPDVSLQELTDRSLELSVFHQNKLKVNEFLGGVRLNLGLGLQSTHHVQWMDAQGSEKEAWEKFLSNPNDYTEATLNLRPNLDF